MQLYRVFRIFVAQSYCVPHSLMKRNLVVLGFTFLYLVSTSTPSLISLHWFHLVLPSFYRVVFTEFRLSLGVTGFDRVSLSGRKKVDGVVIFSEFLFRT